jgi:hypothetical protein
VQTDASNPIKGGDYGAVRRIPMSIDFLLKANSPRNWSPEISSPAPKRVLSGPRNPEIHLKRKRSGLRTLVGQVVRRAYPLVSPFAWRTRSFLLRPQYDIETRLTARIDASEARLTSRLGEVTELMRTTEEAAVGALTEQRRIFISLRNLIEVQSSEIARLEQQISNSAASPRTGA